MPEDPEEISDDELADFLRAGRNCLKHAEMIVTTLAEVYQRDKLRDEQVQPLLNEFIRREPTVAEFFIRAHGYDPRQLLDEGVERGLVDEDEGAAMMNLWDTIEWVEDGVYAADLAEQGIVFWDQESLGFESSSDGSSFVERSMKSGIDEFKERMPLGLFIFRITKQNEQTARLLEELSVEGHNLTDAERQRIYRYLESLEETVERLQETVDKLDPPPEDTEFDPFEYI